jgi:serine/threonine protein phosphatase PrpC
MDSLSLAVCGASDTGVVRKNNEDAFAVVDLSTGEAVDVAMRHTLLESGPRGVLLLVSDGMGGENAGEVASAVVIESVKEHLLAHFGDGGDPAEALRAAIAHANTRVRQEAAAPGRTGMGATVVAALLHGTSAYTAEIGDSRAYLHRQGKLTPISKDQTYVQMLIDRGVLSRAEAKSSFAKNVVMQAVGKSAELVVAQRRLALRRGDTLLLCSDGLYAEMNDPDLEAALGTPEFLDETCGQLVELANKKGGPDNITVIVATVSEPLAAPGPDEPASLEIIREYVPKAPI